MAVPAGSCALASAPTGTDSAMAYDAIMRWENEGGALLPAGSPALARRRPAAARAKKEAAEPLGSRFRVGAVSGLKRELRRPPGAPAA